MLTSVHFKGLKALRDVTIGLSDLTVLVGVNGVGKSTALDGMHMLPGLLSKLLDEPHAHLQQDGDIGPLLSAGAASLLVGLELTGGSIKARLSMSEEDVYDVDWDYREADTMGQTPLSWDRVALMVPQSVRLRLDPSKLAAPSQAPSAVSPLRDDGAGLPSCLSYLAGQRDGQLDRIEAELRTIVPNFRRVRPEPMELTWREEQWINLDGSMVPRHTTRSGAGVRLLVDFDDAKGVPAEHVSEGTLLTLGLLTALHGPQPARLLLIDDLERGLHPGAQQRLIPLLTKLLDTIPDLQIVATTHSPDLVDAVPSEKVWVLASGPNGTVAKPLTSHPEADKWRETLRSGEFWSSAGESWVTDPDA